MLANNKTKYWHSLPESKRQNIKAIFLLVVISLVIVFVISSISSKKEKNLLRDKKKEEREIAKYKMPESISAVEDAWLLSSQKEIDDLRKDNKQKDKAIDGLRQELEKITNKIDLLKEGDSAQLDSLAKKILELESQNKNKPQDQERYSAILSGEYQPKNSNLNLNPLAQNNKQDFSDPFPRGGSGNDYANYDQMNVPEARSIAIVNFAPKNKKKTFDLKNYLPAGSYARAVLISAVDASVGISSQGDPRQVLFRIISDAKSASDGETEPLRVDISGCIVTGAAAGDLSSERAYVRLLKMTCSEAGQVIETDIEGYAADGSDGKSGIVGKVISREGDLVTKSFLAGAISGIGSGLSDKFQGGVTFSDGFSTLDGISSEQIMKQGVGEGIKKSSDNVADYLIKRAEQYQPVVSIASGKEVELVFVSGTYLDGRIIKVNEEKKQSNLFQYNK